MDKKIILSIVIVALIGVVAATYQININDDLLNPLASVDTEDTPVTDVLSAPTSGDSSNTEQQAQAAQQQAQAQQEAQQQAQADAQNSQQEAQQDGNSSSTTQGTTQGSSSLITSNNPITTTGNGSSSSGNSGSSANNGNGSSSGSSTGSSGNTGNTESSSGDNINTPTNPTNQTTTVTNNTNSTSNSTANLRTVPQAYGYIIKQGINATIDQNSGEIEERNDESYVVFEAISNITNEIIHIYVPRDPNSQNTWFIAEDGTGPNDAPSVDD